MVRHNPTRQRIPFFSEFIPAGFPSAAEGYEDQSLSLHALMVPRPAATFFFRSRATCPDEHIAEGSILVVDRSVSPYVGCLALVESEGAFCYMRLADNRLPVNVVG